MAGALKHFFDTVYYPCLDTVAGRPFGLWVHGNNDVAGAVTSVQKIVTGMALVQAAQVVEVTGPIDAAVRDRCYELGATLAVTVADEP